MSELQEIGLRHGTDKSRHKSKGISFLDRYEKHLPDRSSENVIMEIGVLAGKSLKTWEEYFPKSKVIGLDIDPGAEKHKTDRTTIFIGSQDSAEVRDQIISQFPQLDMVLDDASHINELTMASFKLYWPHIKNDGIYIIEDVINTYGDAHTNWPGMKYNKEDLNYHNDREEFEKFIINDLIRKCDAGKDDIFSILFYSSAIIITKKLG